LYHMNNDQQGSSIKEKYPEAVSRKFGEGGYTFLKRVLAISLETNNPVVMSVGGNFLEYSYKDGNHAFMDGVRLIEGDDQYSFDLFKETASAYSLEQGLAEIKSERESHREVGHHR